MSFSLLPVSSTTFSPYPHSSLYHPHHGHTTGKALVFRLCVAGERLKLGFMSKRRRFLSVVYLFVSGRNRGAMGGDDDDDEGNDSETDEEVEELNETSRSSSVLPERWDVLGLGQAMGKIALGKCELLL